MSYCALAVLLLLGTLFFSYVVPQTPGRLNRPSVDLVPEFSFWSWLTSLPVPIPDTSQLVAWSLLCFIIVSFSAYGTALYLSWTRPATRRMLLIVAGMGVLFSFVNVWSLPNLNTDIYNYIVNGRVAAVYGENPYGVAADQFPDDPIYPYASHRFTNEPADKLPAWMALNVFLAKISGDNPVTNLLTYRLALFLINGANLGLVILIVRALDARRTLAGAVLYSWNPIIILFAQSKTDTVMALFVLLAAWALIARRRWFAAFTFLILSVLVKLITSPLIAVVMLRSMKLKRWKEVASGALTAALLLGFGALLLYFSEPDGRLLVKYVIWLGAMGPAESSALSNFILVGFIVLLAVIGLVQDGNDRRLLAGWAVLILYLIFFIADFTRSWYLITAVAIVAVTVNLHLNLLLWAASFFSFVFNVWNSTFTTSEFPSPDIVDVPRSLAIVAIAGVVVAYFAAVLIWKRVRGSQIS